MVVKKGKPVRPNLVTSMLEKKFRPVVTPTKKVAFPLHPLIVAADLRRGSLYSLDQYLRKKRGELDPLIAVELRKLISGTASRSKFRLAVIDHPDGPKAKGGRPKKKSNRNQQIVMRFKALTEAGTKPYIAVEMICAEFGLDARTIDRELKDVARLPFTDSDLEDIREKREVSLRNTRRFKTSNT